MMPKENFGAYFTAGTPYTKTRRKLHSSNPRQRDTESITRERRTGNKEPKNINRKASHIIHDIRNFTTILLLEIEDLCGYLDDPVVAADTEETLVDVSRQMDSLIEKLEKVLSDRNPPITRDSPSKER